MRIYTASDDYSGRVAVHPKFPADSSGVRVRPIVIERCVGLGASSVVLPGCHIREGSCVGALSLVNRPLRPWGIYHGNPVRRINERPRDIDALLSSLRRRLSQPHLRLAN